MIYIIYYPLVITMVDIPKRSCGLTLIELITILGIVIILAVVSIPTFISYAQTKRISGAAEALFYALQYARSEAVKRNTNVYLSFVTGDNWCYGVNAGNSCDCTSPGSCALLSVSAPQSQTLSLSKSGYSSNYVYFESTHGAANSSGSITFTLYNQTKLITIKIGMMGNLQQCSTGISGYNPC